MTTPAFMTTICYQLTVPEVTGVFLRHRQPPRFLFWWRAGSALLGLAMVVASRWITDQNLAAFLRLMGGLLFLLTAGLLLAAPWRRRRAYARELSRYPGLTVEKELSFDERGLVFTAPHTRTEIGWAAFRKIAEDDALICLYEEGSPMPTVIVPKRTLDEAATQEFRRCSAGVATGPVGIEP